MSDPTLDRLERDVEAARSRLAGDLSTLRSPATYSSFAETVKGEAVQAKDRMIESAKSSVRSSVHEVIDDLKARAAANPAAVLAIGAGIGWRLFQKPPIATALIGAGLYSLWQTWPIRRGSDEEYYSLGKERLKEQTASAATLVKEQVVDAAALVKHHAVDAAALAKNEAIDMAGAVKDKTAGLAAAAKAKAQEWGAEAQDAVQRALPAVGGESSHRSGHTAPARLDPAGRRRALHRLEDQQLRDQVLLGAAALAVGAAISIAYQRRPEDEARTDARPFR